MRDINPGDSLIQRPHTALAGITDDSALQTGNRPPSVNLAVPDTSAIQAIQHMAAQIGAAQQQMPPLPAPRQAAATQAAAGTAPQLTSPGLVTELSHLRQPQVVLSELQLPPAPTVTAQSTQPFVDVADLGDLPPADSGSQTLAARGGGVDYGAFRRTQIERMATTGTATTSTDETSTDGTSASSRRRPPTAGERQAVERAIAQGAEGGRVYGVTPQELGAQSWREVVDPGKIGQALYVQAGVEQAGMTQTRAAEFAELLAPAPHVLDGSGHREMTQEDLSNGRVMTAGRYEGAVPETVIERMRAYQGLREQGMSAEAAAGVVLALPGLGLGGSSLAQVGVRVGGAAAAGEIATTLAAAAPVGIALSTLAAPVLITQYMVDAGRVEVEVDEVPPVMWMAPTQPQPASPPPTQPMPPPPVVPPLMDNTARVNTSPLTTPSTLPNIQTSTPPFSTGQVPPLPPPITPIIDDELRRLVTDPLLANFTRPISWPSPSKVAVDMDEITSGHMVGGWRLAPGNKKSIFPADWTAETTERAVREAYRTADRVLDRTGDTLLLEGSARGWRIQMWYNTVTKELETAYPNRADVQGGK